MSALIGWSGAGLTGAQDLLAKMAGAAGLEVGTVKSTAAGGASLACGGDDRTRALVSFGDISLCLVGHPRVTTSTEPQGDIQRTAEGFVAAYRERGVAALENLHGDFALALHDPSRSRTILAVDRYGVQPLHYEADSNGIRFASTLDAVNAHPASRRRMRPQAIFDYLFFHNVPGPRTIYEDTHKVPPGCVLMFERGGVEIKPYWRVTYTEQPGGDERERAAALVAALERAVARAAGSVSCGAFLSGGTDSSTIAGLLGRVTGSPARTYSIGFDVPGYDEMEYARIAARHFGTQHHEYYVTPADVLSAAPQIARAYDQPFGNASALPTYFCARLARADGVDRLLGGDGGDELFGGNARYAKQQVLAWYRHIPASLRTHALEPLVLGPDITQRLPLLRKLRSYVEQARPPMPQRYESYNLLEFLGPERVLEPDFLASVDRGAPHALMLSTFEPLRDASLINQMLGIDLRFTLADSDLPKVTRMCALAGADVAFPMLDDEIVAFSAALPSHLKLRGTTLRYFFKRALRDVLPREILKKKKHGFGLPVGEWLASHAALNELAHDQLSWLRSRRIVRPTFIDELSGVLLHQHPGYYGTMVWLLMVLSMWMQSRRVGV